MLHPPLLILAGLLPWVAPASISLGLPLLGWGLLGIGVPILIHLVFRERAVPEVFPAMQFLVRSHVSATRAQRLRYLLLLLSRALLILLVVGSLGRLGCTREDAATGAAGAVAASPASVVICIDNSAGMGYRYQGQTRVQIALNHARSLLDDKRRFGPGSQFALVTGTSAPGLSTWRDDRHAAVRTLDIIRPAGHSLSAAHHLSRAYGMLAAARHPRREVYFFTDLTESGWTESPPASPPTLTGLFVMDVGQEENRNVALGWPQMPMHATPTGVPLTIPIRISSGDLPSEPVLQFSINGIVRGRQSAGLLEPNSQIEATLHLPPIEAGAHALAVTLEPGDALDADNSRFGWLFGGELPRVGLLFDAPENPVRRMLQAMIAPDALTPAEQRYVVEPVPLVSLLEHALDPLIAVVAADLKGPNGLAWEKLGTYVKAGGTLIVVPGSSMDVEDYLAGVSLLPAEIAAIVACDPPLRPAISDLSQPYLSPFADLSIDSLNDRHAFRRLDLGPKAAQAQVIFPFANGAPALLERRVGRGRTLLLGFSPAAEWGQFGTQAAPMLVLLHRILDTARPTLDKLASIAAGPPHSRAAGDGSSPLLVRSEAGTESTVLPSPNRLYALPAERPDLYIATEKSNPQATVLYYSVNVAESESQLARTSSDMIKSRFDAAAPLQVVRPGDRLEAIGSSGPVRVNWTVPLGVALLALLLIESSFSNRFYRSPGR